MFYELKEPKHFKEMKGLIILQVKPEVYLVYLVFHHKRYLKEHICSNSPDIGGRLPI